MIVMVPSVVYISNKGSSGRSDGLKARVVSIELVCLVFFCVLSVVDVSVFEPALLPHDATARRAAMIQIKIFDFMMMFLYL